MANFGNITIVKDENEYVNWLVAATKGAVCRYYSHAAGKNAVTFGYLKRGKGISPREIEVVNLSQRVMNDSDAAIKYEPSGKGFCCVVLRGKKLTTLVTRLTGTPDEGVREYFAVKL